MAACLNLTHPAVSDGWVALERSVPQDTVIKTAYTKHERLRLRVNLEACVAACYGLDDNDFRWVLDGCDLPLSGLQRSSDISQQLNPKGFWRVDKTGHPEGRLTVLSLVAFHDLHDKIEACGGNVTAGIDAF